MYYLKFKTECDCVANEATVCVMMPKNSDTWSREDTKVAHKFEKGVTICVNPSQSNVPS